jgi:hypothetical protein
MANFKCRDENTLIEVIPSQESELGEARCLFGPRPCETWMEVWNLSHTNIVALLRLRGSLSL